ncbi:glycosyltransferase family 4 protein [Noviherbaspirillum galbum]|uniref:Glycosyltransferase family 4 protein n=1 Tax=Noviherbaspirillum galbum TaxID=2709383 RepID=A0A6B3SVF2_9BURK|nr:glycosyltransferase family 1 protein [Noviherbaspirillum galbum]NEX64481.1 glycosyltransferase family 4 protein [Noviherbaspirillum galbum]
MLPHARSSLESLGGTAAPERADQASVSVGDDLAEKLASLRLGINAVPILTPMAGVGQYTWHLVDQLRQLLPQQPWLFYGSAWDKAVRAPAPAGVRGINSAIKRILPRPDALIRAMRQNRFSKGAAEHRLNFYHEPAFMAFRFAGPTVVTVHDISWVRYPQTHPAARVREMNRIMPGVVRDAAHIVVDSEFVRREVMEHYGVPEDRISTVLLGVAPEFRPIGMDAARPVLSGFNLRHGEYLLAVGTLEPRKNLASVLAAYSRLPGALRARFPLVVTGMNGWGMESLSASLRQMVDRGEVRLTGYVPQANLPALYSGARAFVYPSLYEGFGLPPLEAMACGTPVIASNRASLPEVVGDAGILVEPLDDVAIAGHLQSLIEDHAAHDRCRTLGQQRARMFTWRQFALDTLGVYRRVLFG